MEKAEINPYSYLENSEFTSELYKLEIKNLHSKVGFSQLKHWLKTLKLNPHKIKIFPNVTFVTFKSPEDRDLAIKTITGHIWKGNTLVAHIAVGRADPFILKIKADADIEQDLNSKQIKIKEDNRTEDEKLKDHVTKFWRLTYDEQLTKKQKNISHIFHMLKGKKLQNTMII